MISHRPIKRIIVHCSDSSFGDAKTINEWHIHPPLKLKEIGYHFVITNGVRISKERYNLDFDGQIQPGRAIEKAGEHCKGHNWDSIGVCLIGDTRFTAKQLYQTLPLLLANLMTKYQIPLSGIHAHYEYNPEKTCPNIPIEQIRRAVFVGAEHYGFQNILFQQ